MQNAIYESVILLDSLRRATIIDFSQIVNSRREEPLIESNVIFAPRRGFRYLQEDDNQGQPKQQEQQGQQEQKEQPKQQEQNTKTNDTSSGDANNTPPTDERTSALTDEKANFFSQLWTAMTSSLRVDDAKALEGLLDQYKSKCQNAQKTIDKVKCNAIWFSLLVNKFGRKYIEFVRKIAAKVGGALPESVRNWLKKFFYETEAGKEKQKTIFGMNVADVVIAFGTSIVVLGALGQLIKWLRNRQAQKGNVSEAQTYQNFYKSYDKKVLLLVEADEPKAKSNIIDKLSAALVKLIDFAKNVTDQMVKVFVIGIAAFAAVALFMVLMILLAPAICKVICAYRLIKKENYTPDKLTFKAKLMYYTGKTLYVTFAAVFKKLGIENKESEILACAVSDDNAIPDICKNKFNMEFSKDWIKAEGNKNANNATGSTGNK